MILPSKTWYLVKFRPATLWRTTTSDVMRAIVLAGLLTSGGMVWACNVPVFRYALERWHPDPYRLTLFHRGALTEAQQALLRPLEGASADKSPANVALRLVDVDEIEDEGDRVLFAGPSTAELPRLMVQYPRGLLNEKPIRSVTLADDTVASLVDSPLRRELVRRLADGQTAVWLLLECGQTEKDNAVAATLADELKQLSQRLKLPELTSAPEDTLLADTPLQISFSLLRVPRDVAAEQSLVEMLLGSESDLLDLDEPMVFPVFGRGRALLPLIGAGITADNIHDSAAFLVGACSCEVKDLNPGFDILLAANWDVLLFKEAAPEELLAARAIESSGKPQLVAIPGGAPSVDSKLSESSAETAAGPRYIASTAVVGLLLAVVVIIALKRFA